MIYRERLDATLANTLSNMPENLPFMAKFGAPNIDWSDALPWICMLSNGENAVMALEETEPRLWQCTTIFGPTCRGKQAVETGLAMKEYIRPYADTVFGVVPKSFRHAAWFYRKMGGREVNLVETDAFVYTAADDETLLRMDM